MCRQSTRNVPTLQRRFAPSQRAIQDRRTRTAVHRGNHLVTCRSTCRTPHLQAGPWLSPCGRWEGSTFTRATLRNRRPARPQPRVPASATTCTSPCRRTRCSGPLGAVVQMMNPVITNLDTGQIVTNNSVTTQYLCGLDAISNPPPQGWDGDYFSDEACSNATVYSSNSTLRIRANSQAVPGHYKFTGSFQGELNGTECRQPGEHHL